MFAVPVNLPSSSTTTMCSSSLATAPRAFKTYVEVFGVDVKELAYAQPVYVLASATSIRSELPKSPGHLAAKRPKVFAPPVWLSR